MVKRTLSLAVAFGLFVSAPVSAKVLAEVNGKKITDKDLNRVIDSLPPQYRTLKNNPQFRKQMLNNMVKEEVLYQEALKEGVDKNPQVRQEIEAMKRRIIVQYLLRKHVKPPKVKVTEREAKEFYEKKMLPSTIPEILRVNQLQFTHGNRLGGAPSKLKLDRVQLLPNRLLSLGLLLIRTLLLSY